MKYKILLGITLSPVCSGTTDFSRFARLSQELNKNSYQFCTSSTQEEFFKAEYALGNFKRVNTLFTTAALVLSAVTIFAYFKFIFPTAFHTSKEIEEKDRDDKIKHIRFFSDYTRLINNILNGSTKHIIATILTISCFIFPVASFNYGDYSYFLNIFKYLLSLIVLNLCLYINDFYTSHKDLQDIEVGKGWQNDFNAFAKRIQLYLEQDDIRDNPNKNNSNALHMFAMFNLPLLVAFTIQILRQRYIRNKVETRCRNYQLTNQSINASNNLRHLIN